MDGYSAEQSFLRLNRGKASRDTAKLDTLAGSAAKANPVGPGDG